MPIYLLQVGSIPGAGDIKQKRRGPALERCSQCDGGWWRDTLTTEGDMRAVVHTKGSEGPEPQWDFGRAGLLSFKKKQNKVPPHPSVAGLLQSKPLSELPDKAVPASLEQATSKTLSRPSLGTKCKGHSPIWVYHHRVIFCSPFDLFLSFSQLTLNLGRDNECYSLDLQKN